MSNVGEDFRESDRPDIAADESISVKWTLLLIKDGFVSRPEIRKNYDRSCVDKWTVDGAGVDKDWWPSSYFSSVIGRTWYTVVYSCCTVVGARAGTVWPREQFQSRQPARLITQQTDSTNNSTHETATTGTDR